MIKKISGLTLLILIINPVIIFSQASIVPVYHNVYDWLHYQRVRGNTPFYNYEALPLTRGQIVDVLKKIDSQKISTRDEDLKKSFLKEFDVANLANSKGNSILDGSDKFYNRTKDLIFSEKNVHLYVWNDKNSTIAFDYFIGPFGVFVNDGDQSYSAPYYRASGVRTYGTFSRYWGFHYEQWRAVQIGDNEAFKFLPFFGRNGKFLYSFKRNPNKNHLEAFAGFQKGYTSFQIGRGTLKYGTGQKNNLVFSREGIPFDWVRFNINSKYIKFTSILGSLSWRPVDIPLEGYPGETTRVAPERWIIHQKIQFQPAEWISFGFYEIQLYSDRKLEIGFINPVTRLSLIEWEYFDQGNGFVGFEGVLRPFKGLELFGELLIDDLGNQKDLLTWYKSKKGESNFGIYFGAYYATKMGTNFSAYYQRIDPMTYAHKFILNSYAEKGIGLGSQIGPNGDLVSIGVEQWLSKRTRINISYGYNRHGLNIVDESGNLTFDAGGDILESYNLSPDLIRSLPTITFLEGDLHTWNQYSTTLEYEPWRGFRIKAEYSYQYMLKGNQIQNQSVLNFGILVGY